MSPPIRVGAPVAAVLLAVAALGHLGVGAASRATGSPDGPPFPLTDPQRHGTLRFAPSVAPADRQAVRGAIAAARPEARRLIDAVDGAVTIGVGDPGAGAAGLTRRVGDGFQVTLDLAEVARYGPRAIGRLVLHELGHVVDFALVPRDLAARLDAGIPRGYECAPGARTSACAPREERFAETFAKWATGDLGFYVPLGYAVPPPPSLDAWGRPLAGLARSGG